MLSVIATVKNEGDNLHRLLESLCEQTRPADEIIIVDGGSTDDTVNVLHSYNARLPLQVLCCPGCNISEGRNRAIEAAHGDIIAATDAGQYLAPKWVEALEQPLLSDHQLQVVGGFFEADPQSVFELAMGAIVGRLVDEINPATFLPGSNSIAFRKLAWLAVGGYPEWLDYGEDLVYVLRLRECYKRIVFAPDATVHFWPRSSLPAFFKQYYHYARGDGKADLWRRRHAIRYMTYFVLVPLILIAGITVHPTIWMLYLSGGSLYLRQPYRRLWASGRKSNVTALSMLYAALLLPLIRVTGDAAKMIGYPVGLWGRKRKATNL